MWASQPVENTRTDQDQATFPAKLFAATAAEEALAGRGSDNLNTYANKTSIRRDTQSDPELELRDLD